MERFQACQNDVDLLGCVSASKLSDSVVCEEYTFNDELVTENGIYSASMQFRPSYPLICNKYGTIPCRVTSEKLVLWTRNHIDNYIVINFCGLFYWRCSCWNLIRSFWSSSNRCYQYTFWQCTWALTPSHANLVVISYYLVFYAGQGHSEIFLIL